MPRGWSNNAPPPPYAVSDDATLGRVHSRSESGDEAPFELDYYRIVSCMAFRRLTHKTQVFVVSGDHHRTRLTHTLEVAAQAERLARLIGINARLAGAVAMAHDLGHPPFGHAGEAALAEFMKERGGFEHNAQSLRVVDFLEHPFPAFRGLNLSFEVRESLIKHETRYDKLEGRVTDDPHVQALFEIGPRAPLEGQVANLADAIAYTMHDIEDGLGQGLLAETTLEESDIWREAAAPIREAYPTPPILALRRPIIDSISARLKSDAAHASVKRIEAAGIQSVHDVRRHDADLIDFSETMRTRVEALQDILLKSVYRNHRVVQMDFKAKQLIGDLTNAYVAEPKLLPARFAARIPDLGLHRVICDYLAGMTDRFCQQEHQRLFAPFYFE